MSKSTKVSELSITDLCDEPEALRLEREAREREERNARIKTEFIGTIKTVEANDGGFWITVEKGKKDFGAQCIAEGWTPKKGDSARFTRMPRGHDRSVLIVSPVS
jgi:hypothetical protein